MATVAGKDAYFLRGRTLFRFLVILALLLVLPAGSSFAAEGTAQLIFQKVVPRSDKKHVYTIRNGDTIARILRKLGRSAPRYRAIRQLNPHIADLNRIYPGQQLFLTRPEAQPGAGDDVPEVSNNYTARKGDSITRIIISELHAEPAEAVNLLRLVKQLNPEVTNFNKIHPGQVIKLPRGSQAVGDSDKLPASAPAQSAADDKALSIKPSAADKYIPVIRHIVEQLNGMVTTSGSHYIPLPESGQVTVDCTAIPIVELGDGTTILLDQAGRMPAALAGMIQSRWKNYHVVKIASGQPIAAVLQEILRFSPSFQMVKVEAPLSFDDTPQVKLSLDWLITKKLPSGSSISQLGLIFAAEKSQQLPSSAIAKYALKKGVTICEILGDKVWTGAPDPAEIASLPQIKGSNNRELLTNFLGYLGFDPLPNREVKIFDSRRDGFDLAIQAEYLMKMGGKTILVTKNKLPQQFSDRLKQEGMTSFYPPPEATRTSILEGVLAALDIPSQFALFVLPLPQEQARVRVTFPALKITGEKGAAYFVDYAMDREIYKLLAGHWQLNMIGY